QRSVRDRSHRERRLRVDRLLGNQCQPKRRKELREGRMDAAADLCLGRRKPRALCRNWRKRPVHTQISKTRAMKVPHRGRLGRALRPLFLAACLSMAFAGARAETNAAQGEAALKPKSKLRLLGSEVPPGTRKRLNWTSGAAIEGFSSPAPVIVLNGAGPGPVLCLTAAVHGDELNGIEVVRRVLDEIELEELNGAIIGVPIVNIQGFYRGTRYLPDRRDLNRHFPGNPRGSAATRMAHSFFTEVVQHCSA